MTASRRLVNLAGTLVVLVALIAGTLLIALPVYLESVDINNEETQVGASNHLLTTQIDALRAKQAELPAIQEELDGLHAQLPGVPQFDDVAKLVLKAAARSDSAVTGVEFGDLAPFSPRSIEIVLEGLPKTATEVSGDSESSSEPSSADNAAGDEGDGAADADTGDVAGDEADAQPTGSANQIQIPVTISVIAPDFDGATRFLDELRSGPRLLQIGTVSGTTDENSDEVSLTVAGSIFVQLN